MWCHFTLSITQNELWVGALRFTNPNIIWWDTVTKYLLLITNYAYSANADLLYRTETVHLVSSWRSGFLLYSLQPRNQGTLVWWSATTRGGYRLVLAILVQQAEQQLGVWYSAVAASTTKPSPHVLSFAIASNYCSKPPYSSKHAVSCDACVKRTTVSS